MTGLYLSKPAIVGPKILERRATLDELVEGLAAGGGYGVVGDVEANDRLACEDLRYYLQGRQHLLISLSEDIVEHTFLVRARIP